jgi:iron complex transport system substrate-binding protein
LLHHPPSCGRAPSPVALVPVLVLVRRLRRLAAPAAACIALAIGSPATAQQVQVTVTIDFGGARPPQRHEVTVAKGADVVAVTRAAVPVDQDWLCCSPQDVWAIDGVGPDPRLDRYWSWTLDGRGGPDLPARYRIGGGEAIGWRYGKGAVPEELTTRIVSLLPAATEIALAVGGERALVALSHLCRQPDGRELPRVLRTAIDAEAWSMRRIDDELRVAGQRGAAVYTLDEERIGALRPTHVFSQGLCPVCAVTPEQVAPTLAAAPPQGDGARAQLVVLSPHSLADIGKDIQTVGDAIGRGNAAKVAVRAFERRLAALRALPPLPKRPRVAVVEWFEPLWVSGEWIAELVDLAGGEPVLVGAQQPSRRVTWAELAAADPDVVVLAACSMTIARAERELPALLDQPAWRALRAVAAGQVFVLDAASHVSTPGPGVAAGGEVLARLLREPDAEPRGQWLRVRPR